MVDRLVMQHANVNHVERTRIAGVVRVLCGELAPRNFADFRGTQVPPLDRGADDIVRVLLLWMRGLPAEDRR